MLGGGREKRERETLLWLLPLSNTDTPSSMEEVKLVLCPDSYTRNSKHQSVEVIKELITKSVYDDPNWTVGPSVPFKLPTYS